MNGLHDHQLIQSYCNIVAYHLSDLILDQKRQEKARKHHMKEINKYVCMGACNHVIHILVLSQRPFGIVCVCLVRGFSYLNRYLTGRKGSATKPRRTS